MKINLNEWRIRAGLHPLKESGDDEDNDLEHRVKDIRIRDLEDQLKSKAEIHVSPQGPGILGHVIVIDAFEGMDLLAEVLGIPDGWKMTKIGAGYAAYNSGDRISFFQNRRDFVPDDDEDEEDEHYEEDHGEDDI